MRYLLLALIMWAGAVCAENATTDEIIFADGFGDDACDGGCVPGPVICGPPGPRTVETVNGPTVVEWAGTQSYASLPEVGVDQFTLVRGSGGQWRAYLFGVSDAPGITTWNADTSNTGGFAGARERWFSVSECEGDFTPSLYCYGPINEGPFLTTNYTGNPVAGTCQLDPTKVYYLSVHFGAAPCSDAGPNLCSFRVTHR